MNQMNKTLLFVGAALASAALAFATRTGDVGVAPPEEVGQRMFPDFEDPLAAKSLKIIRFDEGLASLSEIEVKESNGIWTLPSHDGYPADAENRIRDATTPFVDLEVASVVSDSKGDHGLYGVLEPGSDKSAVGDQGVGTLVNIRGAGGKNLVDLIIGKAVKDNDQLRYVCRPGKDRVYTAKINPDSLPVRFENWIEKDLLKLNSWDIDQIVLKDYSFQVAASLSGPVTDYDQRLEMTVRDDNGTWTVEELKLPSGDQLQPTEMQPGQQLSQERINSLRDALDGLEIVNVERKPTGLGADLRAENGFANDQSGFRSLIERGFYPVAMPSGETEMLSADGEVVVRTEQGVEYVLRFGGVEGVDTESEEGKLNRFLLVTARVNPQAFPEPALEALPETVDDLTPANVDQPVDATPESATEAAPDDDSLGAQAAYETRLVAAQELEPPAPDSPSPEPPVEPAEETPATEPAEPAEPAEAPTADATPTDAAVEPDSTPTDDVAAPAPDASPAAPTDLEAQLKAERERITKDNQRKIDERKDKLAKAEEKVRELNYRFADWYYVISEDVYQKIHLSNTDLIEEAKADDATDSDGPGLGGPGLGGPANEGPGFGSPGLGGPGLGGPGLEGPGLEGPDSSE